MSQEIICWLLRRINSQNQKGAEIRNDRKERGREGGREGEHVPIDDAVYLLHDVEQDFILQVLDARLPPWHS